MTLFRNKYRIESSRLPKHDYRSSSSYFITIVTKNRTPYFGKISVGKTILNSNGFLAEKIWLQITNNFSNVELDEYVFMPDHMHAILHFNASEQIVDSPTDEKLGIVKAADHVMHGPVSLGTVVRWYKAKCTFEIRNQLQERFEWLPRYHESIIRNYHALEIIRSYIRTNPERWKKT